MAADPVYVIASRKAGFDSDRRVHPDREEPASPQLVEGPQGPGQREDRQDPRQESVAAPPLPREQRVRPREDPWHDRRERADPSPELAVGVDLGLF